MASMDGALMGADLLCAVMYMKKGRTPDWPAASARVLALTDQEAAEADQNDLAELSTADLSSLRDQLVVDVDLAREAWDGDDRTACGVTVGDWEVLITGGMSWGDSPTELFDSVLRLDRCGALASAGFFREEGP